ncbi:hypothetical protein TL16_g03689 [Triparma laevis f. inornata]|uniref:Ketopantoate reductase C-terminal domain-containing protein n=1 Tax=Triparma laevis f. inornata TaxID=1714386 RepID=A0A9W7A8P9_9STRA|nr:hypothetical protein TL16_g03689 [Triparma laevis f. inornata]
MGIYYPSTLLDYREGLELELRFIFDEVIERAKVHGIDIPVTAKLVNDLHKLQDDVQSETPAETPAFDGLTCGAFKLEKLKMGEQAKRLSRFAFLKSKAFEFIKYKNAGDLASIFSNLTPNAEVYGLKGDSIETGLTDFFENYKELHHEIIGEPIITLPDTVEYRFVKSWIDGECGERKVWESRDEEKGRDKVERLIFCEDKLLAVSVVEVIEFT